MLQYIFWSSVLGDDDKPVVHHGHITTSPPHSTDPYMAIWFFSIIFAVVFLVISIPILSIWWDIKKHPNKPVRRVAKK